MKEAIPTTVVKEGLAEVEVPDPQAYAREGYFDPSWAPVFYNPRMVFNRDIAVLALQCSLTGGIRICEPLAGTGVRGIRFALEIDGVEEVILGDINKLAVKLVLRNVRRNRVEDKVKVFEEEANRLLSDYSSPEDRFDAVDVDPFGPPTPFVDSAIRALRIGGILCLTATDMAPLCGVYPMACFRKYFAKPLKTEYCSELAVRIVVGMAVREAAKRELALKPLLAYSVDHYVRVYGTLEKGAQETDALLAQIGYVAHCSSCLWRATFSGLAPRFEAACPRCGERLDVAGPLWLGKLADVELCKRMLEEAEKREYLQTRRRASKLLELLMEEGEMPPTYYVIDQLCRRLRCSPPPMEELVENLRGLGFKATRTHFDGKGLKTEAPIEVIEEVLKEISPSS